MGQIRATVSTEDRSIHPFALVWARGATKTNPERFGRTKLRWPPTRHRPRNARSRPESRFASCLVPEAATEIPTGRRNTRSGNGAMFWAGRRTSAQASPSGRTWQARSRWRLGLRQRADDGGRHHTAPVALLTDSGLEARGPLVSRQLAGRQNCAIHPLLRSPPL